MSSADQRKEIRFSFDLLPPEYLSFTILLSHGQTATVTTIDASRYGFGFTVDLSSDNFIVGSKIVLYPLGEDSPVYGVIVYSHSVLNSTRVGVMLQHLGGYDKFVVAINELEKKEL